MNFTCITCGSNFGSKWALDEHAPQCPARLSTQIGRLVEEYEGRLSRIIAISNDGFRSAANAFSAYLADDISGAAQRHDLLAHCAEQVSEMLNRLGDDIKSNSKLAFPRFNRLNRLLGDEIQRGSELVSILKQLDTAHPRRR